MMLYLDSFPPHQPGAHYVLKMHKDYMYISMLLRMLIDKENP